MSTQSSASNQAQTRADKENVEFEALKRNIHGKLVEKLDLSRLGDLEGDTLRREIRLVIEHFCDTANALLNRSERERLIEEILDETFGFGPLEMLLKEPGIADIMINACGQRRSSRAGDALPSGGEVVSFSIWSGNARSCADIRSSAGPHDRLLRQ